MNQNAELLNFIYQNSEMGEKSLQQLEDAAAEDEKFLEVIKKQRMGYHSFHEKAKEFLNKNGYDEKEIGSFEKISAYFMINMQTMMDKSTSHMAEMMLKGSNMGIIDAVKRIHKYEEEAEKDILSLMKDLLDFEEKNVETIKKFL